LSEENKLQVTITYGSSKTVFLGKPETVIVSINQFLSKQIPALNLAEKLTLNYSISELIDNFKEYIKLTEEGPRVWMQNRKLSDKDTVCLQLITAKIGYMTGNLTSPSLTLQDIHNSTNLKTKSISSRLSEVTKSGYVERDNTDQGTKYKITTQGIHWLSGILEKKLGSVKS
jgi:predicted transcriptional regulator|tara:strand:- start:1165 stop:1680 length:516 start_codon:yes stop_codon:yes gene_type:complete